MDHARTFFARLPGITFLNGFYVLNSNGARFARAYLYVPTRPVCSTSMIRTISVSHPLIPRRHFRPCSPSTSPSPAFLSRVTPPHHSRSLSAGRFFAVGTISLCQTGAGLICEAFAGTPRPRIIIKIPHRPPSVSRPRLPAFTFRDITFHSELDQSFNGRKFNLCAATK